MSADSKKTAFSLAKSIGFRPGPDFRAEVEQLATDARWRISDIVRVGMLAFWPDIKALVMARGGNAPKQAEEIRELREFIELCRSAQARGVDPKTVLTDALEAKLGAEACATV